MEGTDGERKNRFGAPSIAALALLTMLSLKLFVVDLMITQGRSMLPALKPGSVLLVNKAAFGLRLPIIEIYLWRWSKPHSGDMVVFYTPLGERAVKRCSWVSGDGSFFALGDNDLESFDSRSYGPVSAELLLGKVIAVR
ncbi:MAG: signal peptidase I [Treponema sp.]|jgi:signal peptidase I|nr:signal peptidase I [Treponema sp.]